MTAGWHNGSAAMIGKSYDGTLANGVAATGVEGLKTIVPISAISDWYRYSRMNGIRLQHELPVVLANTVTNAARRARCARRPATHDERRRRRRDRRLQPVLGRAQPPARASPDVKACRLRRPRLPGRQRQARPPRPLVGRADGATDVPRKLWLLRGGHVDPFDSRRAVWVDTLHRWFDHWLLGVDNGIMDEPRVDDRGGQGRLAHLRRLAGARHRRRSTCTSAARRRATARARSGCARAATVDTLGLDRRAGAERDRADHDPGRLAGRPAASSSPPPLKRDLRISGTPVVDIRAALDKPQSNLGAVVVDYGPGTQVTRSRRGHREHRRRTDCWGVVDARASRRPARVIDHGACYLKVTQAGDRRDAVAASRAASSTRPTAARCHAATPVTLGAQTRFAWPLVPDRARDPGRAPARHRAHRQLLGRRRQRHHAARRSRSTPGRAG